MNFVIIKFKIEIKFIDNWALYLKTTKRISNIIWRKKNCVI